MAISVLREVVACLQQSPFITLMMDETTDISHQEQSVFISTLAMRNLASQSSPISQAAHGHSSLRHYYKLFI